MKKIILSLVFGIALLFSAQSVFAAGSDHVIRSWHTSVFYRADNVAEVTETITVDYLREKHGFFRSVPYIITIEKDTGGALRDMRYRARIKNIRVTGSKFDTSTENDNLVIKIGDEDRTVFGEVDYVVSYTFDMGDDRVSEYDEMFFTLLGADNQAKVENFSFDVSFEKPLPDPSAIKMYSGTYGSLKDSVEFTATDTAISGRAIGSVYSGSAITLYARLPEGYFEGERGISLIALYALLALAAGLLVFGVYSRISQNREQPVQTVEFTAPDGITSAEVGYIIDNVSEDKDVLSLIIWFADKGYLTVEGEENDITLTKLRDLPQTMPGYMREFFSALFGSGNACRLNDAGISVYEGLQAAKQQLANEFTGERKLYSTAGTVLSYVLPILAAPLYAIGAITAADALSDAGIACAVVGAATLIISGIIGAVCATQWQFASMGKRAALCIGILAPLAVGGGLSLICSYTALGGFALYPTLLYAVCAFAGLACSQLAKPTHYNVEISGKLLGLRNFIKEAELDRLKVLAAEDPQYFYNVLPYAYVFGLTDVWIKQFESIPVPPPTYYHGASPYNIYSVYWITRGMSNAHTHMLSEMAAQSAKSGGKGGTSFNSGGGFSGGGFGGGGSGSW